MWIEQKRRKQEKSFSSISGTAFTNKLHQLELNSIEKYINDLATNGFFPSTLPYIINIRVYLACDMFTVISFGIKFMRSLTRVNWKMWRPKFYYRHPLVYGLLSPTKASVDSQSLSNSNLSLCKHPQFPIWHQL
jgi:hypothetical protein